MTGVIRTLTIILCGYNKIIQLIKCTSTTPTEGTYQLVLHCGHYNETLVIVGLTKHEKTEGDISFKKQFQMFI